MADAQKIMNVKYVHVMNSQYIQFDAWCQPFIKVIYTYNYCVHVYLYGKYKICTLIDLTLKKVFKLCYYLSTIGDHIGWVSQIVIICDVDCISSCNSIH